MISTITATQVYRAISPVVRKNITDLCIFRLRNQSDLDAVIEETSAIYQAVDAINSKWDKHFANGKQLEVAGFKQSEYMLHAGLEIMAYRSGASKTYLNSEEFIVKSFNKDKMCLQQTDTKNEI